MSKRIIITGGTGLIGSALSSDLAQAGYEVIVLSRNPGQRQLPPGVQAERWDASTADHWGHLANGAHAIVNLAGENIAGSGIIPSRWTRARKERIALSRLHAGQAVTAAIEAASEKPAMLLQTSGVDYYPPGDQLVDEGTAPGTDFLARVCVDYWEKPSEGIESLGVRRVVARTGIVLDRNEGSLPLIALPYRLFVGGPLGGGRQIWSWIHIEDVVGAYRFLIENDAAHGTYNVAAPDAVSNREFGQTVGRVLGRPSLLPVPAFALKIVLGEMAAIVLNGRPVSSRKLQAAGYSFAYPKLQPALASLLS